MSNEHDTPHHRQVGSNQNRDSLNPGPSRSVDRPASEDPHATTEDRRELPQHPDQRRTASDISSERVLIAQVKALLQEIHYHPQLPVPDVDKMKALREESPEVYKAFVRSMHRSIDAEYEERTGPYVRPSRDVRFGQVCGVIVVLGVLALAGYALYLDRPWVASLLAGLDIVALAAIFASGSKPQEPDHDT